MTTYHRLMYKSMTTVGQVKVTVTIKSREACQLNEGELQKLWQFFLVTVKAVRDNKLGSGSFWPRVTKDDMKVFPKGRGRAE